MLQNLCTHKLNDPTRPRQPNAVRQQFIKITRAQGTKIYLIKKLLYSISQLHNSNPKANSICWRIIFHEFSIETNSRRQRKKKIINKYKLMIHIWPLANTKKITIIVENEFHFEMRTPNET